MSYLCIVIIKQTNTNMKAKVGLYHFGRHRGLFGIWVYTHVDATGSVASFVKDVCTFEDAVKETYSLNGWGQPKQISQKY